MSRFSLNHVPLVPVIKCGQIRKRCRNVSIIGVSSLVNQSDLDYRMHNFNLCNKETPAGTYHNHYW